MPPHHLTVSPLTLTLSHMPPHSVLKEITVSSCLSSCVHWVEGAPGLGYLEHQHGSEGEGRGGEGAEGREVKEGREGGELHPPSMYV